MMKYGLIPHPALPLGDQIFSNKTWKHHILDTQSFALCLGNLEFTLLLPPVLTNSRSPYLSFWFCTWKQHNAVTKELLIHGVTVIIPQSNKY